MLWCHLTANYLPSDKRSEQWTAVQLSTTRHRDLVTDSINIMSVLSCTECDMAPYLSTPCQVM